MSAVQGCGALVLACSPASHPDTHQPAWKSSALHGASAAPCLAWSHLEGLDEGPEKDADGVALPQQLDEAGGSEEPQETQVDHFVLRREDRTPLVGLQLSSQCVHQQEVISRTSEHGGAALTRTAGGAA